ncbi:unnamed protein product [Thelazia callipaeda]|uniref:Peptidase A1 domain-containing protein n=1 Tax=Thelazia callipaeda TaxID=103827 RepID=A0A0N5D3B9_THECL|nr:unnamed protein product [Thelazia callipaeda]
MLQYLLIKLLILTFVYLCWASNLHRIPLYPVYSETNQHLGYALKVIIGIPEEEYTLMHSFCLGKKSYGLTGKKSLKIHHLSRHGIVAEAWKDTVSFEGLNGSLTFENFEFAVAVKVLWPDIDDYTNVDGLFGLFRSFTVANPMFTTMMQNNILPSLGIAAPPMEWNKDAVLTLGGFDQTLCDTNNPLLLARHSRILAFPYSAILFGKTAYQPQFELCSAFICANSPYISVASAFMDSIVRKYNLQYNGQTRKYLTKSNNMPRFLNIYLHENENNRMHVLNINLKYLIKEYNVS